MADLSANDILVIAGALVAIISAFTAGFIAIYKVIDNRDKVADAKLDGIHVLVNSRLDSVKEDLASAQSDLRLAVEYITVLTRQLEKEGVAPKTPPKEADA